MVWRLCVVIEPPAFRSCVIKRVIYRNKNLFLIGAGFALSVLFLVTRSGNENTKQKACRRFKPLIVVNWKFTMLISVLRIRYIFFMLDAQEFHSIDRLFSINKTKLSSENVCNLVF